MIAALFGALLLVAIVGYTAIGFAYASTRINNADRTLNNVTSHQNQLNSTFHDLDSQFSALNSGSAFNPTKARSVIDQFVSNSQAAGTTIEQDDASLRSASGGLDQARWLTTISRSSLDREASRIGHARKALFNARTVAADYVLDGQFLQAFMDSIVDLGALGNQSSSADFAGAKTTLATMKTHVDRAIQLSTAPGLPAELHSLMLDFQSLIGDFGKLIDAAQASDDAGVATYEQSVQSDGAKISSYNFDTIGAKINAFYKPLVDGFNSEMAAATS